MRKSLLSPVFAAVFLSVSAGDLVFENAAFRLVVGEDAVVKSLVGKAGGEELLETRDPVPFMEVTQPRPFNNEIKLAWMNQRTTYPANRLRREGEKLVVGFETAPYEALVSVKTTGSYIAFTLEDFLLTEKSYPLCPTTTKPLDFTAPPVDEFRLVQLPVRDRARYGMWLNVAWDERAAVAVVATNPETTALAPKRNGYRLFSADALRSVKLRGAGAAIVVARGGEAILDDIAAIENDYGLPKGVENRRNPLVNASIYFARNVTPKTVDRHIETAKKGGFRLMEISYKNFFRGAGDYEYNSRFPNGFADVREVLGRLRAAGITPGLHILHTFISPSSPLVKGGADRRLLLRETYTLARELKAGDTEAWIDEDPKNAELSEKCRILRFGRELMTYEGFTTERPFRFYGLKRGHAGTPVSVHEEGLIGGTLWVCEYGGHDYYLKPDSDLQDQIAARIGDFWKAGMGFIYFDGSEGVSPPFAYNVPFAQYRIWRRLDPAPMLAEGAAKAHFGWHMLSGANAFDVFFPEDFKAKIDEYPAAEAPHMWNDFTRVNFGWWGFWPPKSRIRDFTTIGTQADMWEYGTSKAAAWGAPVSVQLDLGRLAAHPRSGDILEVMRRWEDVRARNWLTPAQKEALKKPGEEYHLYLNDRGGYELVRWEQLEVAGGRMTPVRAFLFERGGRRVVAYWHTSGSGSLALGDGTLLEAGNLRYWETALPAEAVRAAFAGARIESRE